MLPLAAKKALRSGYEVRPSPPRVYLAAVEHLGEEGLHELEASMKLHVLIHFVYTSAFHF